MVMICILRVSFKVVLLHWQEGCAVVAKPDRREGVHIDGR